MRDRLVAGGSAFSDVAPPEVERLFADLENCTVANEIGYQGEDFGLHFGEAISLGRRSRLYRRENREIPPRERPPGFFPITVKIVRAHGGCLGTKSR